MNCEAEIEEYRKRKKRQYHREYYAKNRERALAAQKRYYWSHREKELERQHEWRGRKKEGNQVANN